MVSMSNWLWLVPVFSSTISQQASTLQVKNRNPSANSDTLQPPRFRLCSTHGTVRHRHGKISLRNDAFSEEQGQIRWATFYQSGWKRCDRDGIVSEQGCAAVGFLGLPVSSRRPTQETQAHNFWMIRKGWLVISRFPGAAFQVVPS